jgi:hypothetical protein
MVTVQSVRQRTGQIDGILSTRLSLHPSLFPIVDPNKDTTMTIKPALYAGLIACALIILVRGADGRLTEGVAIGVATLLGTMLYARSRRPRAD